VAVNIKEEKYNNAIKSFNEYKKSQPDLETPLRRVLPILEKKVEGHLRKLLESFWLENQRKMLDIGRNCFNKMSSNRQEKLNIYHILFGDNLARSSLMNRASTSSFRCTVLERENSSRIMKTSEDTVDYFQKVLVRVPVEMSTLKKVKVMQVELNSLGIFNDMLRASLNDHLSHVEQTQGCEKEEQFVDLLAQLLGLMLVKREVCAFFDIQLDEKVFLTQTYLFLGREIRSLSVIIKSLEIMLSTKEHFLVFHRLLGLLDLNDNTEHFNAIVSNLLAAYQERSLSIFEQLSAQAIASDNLTHYATEDSEKDALIREMLDLGSEEFKFTSYVIFALEYLLKTYNEVTKLIEESDINHSAILDALRTLFERALQEYGAEVAAKQQHYEIIQGAVNLSHIRKGFGFIVRQLEIYHGVVVGDKGSEQY
jgi:hypothetical protein